MTFDLDELVAACQVAVADPEPRLAIRDVLQRAMTDADALADALGRPQSAGLQRLHVSPELTVLNVVWAPGMSLYPHDHRMWAAIAIYGGKEDNTFWRRTAGGLQQSGGKRLERADVTLLGDDTIHSVANPERTFTGAIHVYGGDFFSVPRSEWDPETLEERPYDVQRAMAVFAEADAAGRAADSST